MVECPIKEIDSDYAESLLLFDVGLVEQPHVDDNLARLRAWIGLKATAQPAVRFAALFKTARHNCVCKDEEGFLRPKFCIEPFDKKIVFVVEHCVETNTADITVRRSVDCVAECHVVGRHGLGDGTGSSADAEKPARYFLAGANLR